MPDWRAEIRHRLAPLALSPTREIEIADEIAQHLEDRFQTLRTAGESDEDAAAATWRELDDAGVLARTLASVETRAPLHLPAPGADTGRGGLGSIWQDLRYSARALRHSPGFSVTVLLAVALSIGPVTAILSVGNWLFWRPHPGVTDARALAVVWFGRWSQRGETVSVSPAGVSYENLSDIQTRSETITGIAGVQESQSSLAVPNGLPRQARTAVVTANFFDVLGVRLAAGRTFTPEEDRMPSGSPVVVISSGLARAAFGSPQGALGKTISLNSRAFSVIGVAPPAFAGISNAGGVDAWMTGATWPYLNHSQRVVVGSRDAGMFYEFVVRRTPAATFGDVEAELTRLSRQLADLHPSENEKFLEVTPRVFPGLGLAPLTRPRMAQTLKTMLAIGGILLVLGCANVANLLMFRTARRQPEIAIRKALGAPRFRLIRLQMMESWLLSAGGAIAGIAIAVYLKQVIGHVLFPRPPGVELSMPIDMRVLALTAAATVGAGTVAALAPGWLAIRTQGMAALGRAAMNWGRAPRLRSGLAVVQLALSLVLLIGALLLVSTVRNLQAVDLGLDPRQVHVVHVDLGQHGYDTQRALAYHRGVLPALQATPGFEAVSLSGLAPFGSGHLITLHRPDTGERVAVRANGVTDTYFSVLSIPIVRGRPFTPEEVFAADDRGVLIINESLARQLFGTVDVPGRTVRVARTSLTPEQDLLIVGVAGDSQWRSVTDPPDPFMYQPFAEFRRGRTSGVYLIKSTLPAHRVGETANAVAARFASAIPVMPAGPLTNGIDSEMRDERLFARMLTVLSVVGFALAALGLYGLVAQTTVERRHEFGIRVALGATRRNIVTLVARHAAIVSALGAAVGVVLAYFGTRLVRSMLFGVSPLEPSVYITAVATLLIVVMLACIAPAVRALRVHAVDVLKSE